LCALSQPAVTDVFLALVAEERDDVRDLVPITQFTRGDQVRALQGGKA
jgi:hypothetical protein